MEPLSSNDPVQVAGYQIRARLGAGGMGRVYLAYTPGGRPVALKVVRAEFGTNPDFRDRFRHEVDAARRVHGLYTAQVLDADPDATPPWLVTAYVPGPSLQLAVAQHGPMPPDTVFQLMAGVAEALGAIHAAGVVHRDLKPSNVILAPDGPRVIDFGIARAADASAITRQGMRVGSPQFMAPEQILGRPPTPALDVFALGHLAAYSALGHSPFGDGDAPTVFARILNQPPDLTGCTPPLRALIERCMSKDPDARPAPADVLATCREHQNPQTVRIAGTWLPPAMAEALAQHAAPQFPRYAAQPQPGQPQPPPTGPFPPPTRPYPVGATPPSTGMFIPRATLVRAGVAIAVIGALAGLGVAFLHGSNSAGPTAPLHSSSAAAAAATASQPSSAGSAASSPSSDLDSCLFGTWTGVSQEALIPVGGTSTEFSGPGPTDTFQPDGTAVVDFGSGTTLRAVVDGVTWTDVISGSATADFQTGNGTLVENNVQSAITGTLYADGIFDETSKVSLATPTEYACSGDSLRISSSQTSVVLVRAG